jgi:hypothetical protein
MAIGMVATITISGIVTIFGVIASAMVLRRGRASASRHWPE